MQPLTTPPGAGWRADARLHMVLGDTIHEVVVQALHTEVVDSLAPARAQWLDTLALPAA